MTSFFLNIIWRISRKFYMMSRNEVIERQNYVNNLEFILKSSKINNDNKIYSFLDIGASKGDWVEKVYNFFHLKKVKLFLVEPDINNYKFLKNKFSNFSNLKIFKLAASDVSKKIRSFYISNKPRENSSFYQKKDFTNINKITCITIDDLIKQNDIKNIFMIKIDAEGEDFRVLKGSYNILKKSKVEIVQFEYNHLWINNKNYLLDVFKLIRNKNYYLAKIINKKFNVFLNWNPEIERYFECDYFLIKKNSVFAKHFVFYDFNNQNVIQKIDNVNK